MLEDSKMDKKSNSRSSQTQPRASAVDCKKNSESTFKPIPRYNKKREGPSGAPKNDASRRVPVSQKGRGQMDRRPRARGTTEFSMGGTENTGIAEDEPELGSVFVPGSKKQNLNHLLNFMYPSPGGAAERRGPPPRRSMVRSGLVHPHNHDLYLQACCQFVVKEDGDYKLNLLDPDIPVKWDQIEEIVVRSTGKSECPICLGAPVAGRVGHCGHVHCWPCALHYAATHDKQPPPCPVCAAPFKVDTMKPARVLQWETPSEEVTMRLVRRPRGSSSVEIAPPRGVLTDLVEPKVMSLTSLDDLQYCKLFSASKQQVMDLINKNKKELQDQILEEIDTTEIIYIEQALDLLKKQEDKLNNEVVVAKIEKDDHDTPPTIFENNVTIETKIDWFDESEGAASLQNIKDNFSKITLKESNLNPEATEFGMELMDNKIEEFPLIEQPFETQLVQSDNLTDIDKDNQAKYFYFYQAGDGQQVFLNSLNVRLLNASWGALAAAPATIRGRVLYRETLSLLEQTRKHMPYAAHLPLHCPFDIVELDLKPPYVTKDALNTYADELERRARTRARQARDEKRRERAYRRTIEGPPKPDFSSEILFPPTSPPQFSCPLDASLPIAIETPSNSSTPPQSALSFAKMASTSGTWRVRPTQSTRPATPPPEDGAAPRTLCLNDAIDAALKAVPSSTSNNSKKKKNKPKVLFATAIQRTA